MAKDIMEMSSQELKALKATLDDTNSTPEQREALADRIVDVIVEEKIAAAERNMEAKGKAKDLDKKAYSMWPGLKDENSAFRKAVNDELAERGDSATNPRALFDAAAKVGLEMGEAPAGWAPSKSTMGILKIKGTGNQDDDGPEGEKKTYIDSHKNYFDALAREGYIDPKNEKQIERINAAGEAKRNG